MSYHSRGFISTTTLLSRQACKGHRGVPTSLAKRTTSSPRALCRRNPAALSSADTTHPRPHPYVFPRLDSSFPLGTASLALAGALAALAAWALDPFADEPSNCTDSERTESEEDTEAAFAIMPETRQGWLGNLTPQQEQALKELWERLGKITNTIPSDRASMDSLNGNSPPGSTSPSIKSTKKKKRFSMLRRSGGDEEDEQPEDKHGQEKDFKQALADQTPEQLRNNIWSFLKCDNPDAVLLRFLRARKWDVHNALVMLISTAHWRGQIALDDELMPRGEAYYADLAKNGTGEEKKLGEDFMAQMRKGKSFIHGVDRQGRPLCYVRVRLHHASDQSVESLEKFTVYTIETARMMLRDPVDTAGIVFDMSNFSMANMDYTPVKFMIKVFEANYPESLGHICVHRSPWIFNTIWGIIKGWLDPVVASKIGFTKDVKDLEEFIAPENIPKELGGKEDWEYAYVEPRAGEAAPVRSAAASPEHAALAAERAALVDEFEKLTLQWVRSDGPDGVDAQRQAIAAKLGSNYWRLDPFVRAPTLYDRTGVISAGGAIDMYPERHGGSANGAAKTAATAAAAAGLAPKMDNLKVHDADSDDERSPKSFETAREY